MSDDTKDMLGFSVLLVLFPIEMVAMFCATGFFAVHCFGSLDPSEALLAGSVLAGILNGAGFLLSMMLGRFVLSVILKITKRRN